MAMVARRCAAAQCRPLLRYVATAGTASGEGRGHRYSIEPICIWVLVPAKSRLLFMAYHMGMIQVHLVSPTNCVSSLQLEEASLLAACSLLELAELA